MLLNLFVSIYISTTMNWLLALGSLLTSGILKVASVPAYLLEANCALAQAAGKAPIDLEAERIFKETIVIIAQLVANRSNSRERFGVLYMDCEGVE
jgi:hypothetical protein